MENTARKTDRTGRDDLHTEPTIGNLESLTATRPTTQKENNRQRQKGTYNRIATWAAIDAALIVLLVYLYKTFVFPLMFR
jgi:hypothetical protein